MKRRVRGLLLAAAVLGWAVPAASQDAEGLVGTWAGTITEDDTYYEAWVEIDLDKDNQPVGLVAYTQPCQGVWASGSRDGRGWRFDETITGGRDLCASHVAVKLTGSEGALEVELHTLGSDAVATGTLQRQDQSALEAAAEAAGEAVDAAADEALALDAAGYCGPGETGIEYGQAGQEPWFVRGDPIRLYGQRYVKQGRPRVLELEKVVSYGSYADAGVFAELADDNDDSETLYVLVGPPGRGGDGSACEFQGYEPAG